MHLRKIHLLTLALGIFCSVAAGLPARAADDRKALLLLPVASGTPGQEWSAKALGGILEDGFGSVRSVRLVTGIARETALRELSAGATVTPEAFRDICRRAGADLALLGGSTLVAGRLALEVRVFDVGATRELPPFRGEEPPARAFNLVESAIQHVAAKAGLGAVPPLFPSGVTVSLEAYAAYRAALIEEAPAARIEKLRGALKLDAEYAEPTRRLGVELFRQGTLDEALSVLARAVALGPKVAEARNNYGVALAAAGQPDQALREFEEAVALAPDYAEARLNLARVFQDRGRASDAEKQYAAVLETDAGNDKARAGLAALYDVTGRPELAVKEFRLLSARRPDLAEGEFIRNGQEARKAHEYSRAEKFFLRAGDINPQFAQAWAELGTNSYLAGEFSKGVEYFRKALTIDPGQAAYHYYLGLALEKNRQQDEGLKEYRRAVELGGPPEARLGLARAALESGDPGLSVEELNRLLVASPDNAEAKILLAQATTEMEARRRLVEGQSQFANQRLARLEQIVADANRANRELEARLQAVTQEKQLLEKQPPRERAAGPVGGGESPPAAVAAPTAVAKGSTRADSTPTADETARESARAGELAREIERLRGELSAERDARRREGAEAQAGLALLRADKERREQEFVSEQEKFKREAEGHQAGLAAAQAKGLEVERLTAELAALEAVRGELVKKSSEAAEFKGQLVAAQGSVARVEEAQRAEREQGERALAAERRDRLAEVEKLRSELAAGQFKKQEKDRLVKELAAEKTRIAAAQAHARTEQAAREKAEQALAGERTQAGKTLADEREQAAKALAGERAQRQSDNDKLKAEAEAAAARAQDRDRLAQELAAEQAHARTEQAAREKAEQELATLRNSSEKAIAAERQRAEQELAGQRTGSERALAAERERGERAAVAEREESHRQEAQFATRIGVLETQVKTLTESIQSREAELIAARARESALVAQFAKGQSDLELLAERYSTLESRTVTAAQTIAERDSELEKARLAVRNLALELGNNALRTQSWEKARGFLEQAAEVDPRSAEAWYGLGEAFFQLGQYEKSKQMYEKAKHIY